MSSTVRRMRRLVPVLALAALPACFATRDDLVVIQQDIATTRTELLAADSARRQQLDRILVAVTAAEDTISTISRTFTNFQANVQSRLENYGDQLIRVQELLGVSQQQLQRLRADLERTRGTAVAPAGTPGGAQVPPAGVDAGAEPPRQVTAGPAQLMEAGRQQQRRGASGVARQQFEDLVRAYPDDDLVPEALFYIAETYATERNEAAADSVWVKLYTDHPDAPRAPEAMYRHGVALENGGRRTEARRIYQQVIRQYPRSDAAKLAQGRLDGLS
jgi:tol-pal system protein YbgF